MPKAIFNGTVIAESDQTILLEGNHYFPPNTIKHQYFMPNSRTTICPWKGMANYYDISVGDQSSTAAAWYYAAPKTAAKEIEGHIAFYSNKVKIEE
ncbi:MAG TPA: DUF427 domain-containing protein [Anaerolineae bacterium]|nr:DUF427 domain-containing protein [Anaerolineae bacterium]